MVILNDKELSLKISNHLKFQKLENIKYSSAIKQWAKHPSLIPEKSNGKDLCDYKKRRLF